MPDFWLKGWMHGRESDPQKLRALLEDFARTHDIQFDFEVEESLWPTKPGSHDNPRMPLANNEITDGPMG